MKKILLSTFMSMCFAASYAAEIQNKVNLANSSSCDDSNCIVTITLEATESKDIIKKAHPMNIESINIIANQCNENKCEVIVKVPKQDQELNVHMLVNNESGIINQKYAVPEYYRPQ